MKRFVKSLRFAMNGIGYGMRTQRHMRFHAAAAAAVVAVGLTVGLSPAQWGLLLLTVAVVMAAELMNTAIEKVVDMISPDPHPLAKAAKDTAAGAVLIAAIAAAVIGIIILGPPLWRFLGLAG